MYTATGLFVAPGRLPWVRQVAWVGNWVWVPSHACTALMLLPFLVGRLPSPRWRPVAWTVGVAGGLTLIGAACRPALLDVAFLVEDAEVTAQLTNPLGVAALGQLFEPFLLVLLLGEAVGAAALLLRFRRSRGIERQQLKWIAYAALLFGIQQGGLALARLAGVVPDTEMAWPEVVDTFTFVFSFVAIAVAVLRYRLYEIDRLINRTLVYVLVTVLLGAVYTAGVFGLGRLLNRLPGRPPCPWPPPPWPWRPCSSRSAAASKPPWIGASTAAATTPPRLSRHLAPGSATKWTWTLFPLPLQVRAMCSA
jgi:predicted membrane protein